MQASRWLKPAFVPSHSRVAVLVALAALLTLLSPANLYAVPLGAASSLAPAVHAVTEEQLTVPVRAEADGIPVSLEVAVWRPDGGGPHPAVLLAHGFGGSVADLREQGRKLAERGYLAVGYSARGFGASGGRIHLNDPEFEIADARALVDLIAARSDVVAEVRADGSRDPRVGVVGASYGGALALMLGSTDPRVDSVTAYITWNDLADAFFPQRARTGGAAAASDALPGPFKALWAARFFGSATAPARTAESPASSAPPAAAPTVTASAAAPTVTPSAAKLPTAQPSPVLCGRFDPTVCRLFLAATEAGTPSPELLALLRAHSPKPLLAGLRAPTYLVQGMADSLFDLSHADATARALQAQGTPVAVRWIDGGHDGTSSTATDDEDALTAWLDTSLRDGKGASGVPGFVYAAPIPRRQSVAPLYAVPTYGVGAGSVSIPFAPVDRPRSLANPPGGTPAAVSSLGGLPIPATGGAAYQLAALPGQSVAFDTELLTDRLAIVGAPTVKLRVTSTAPSVTLFLTLWQVTGESASLPRKLVAPITFATTPGVPTSVEVALPAATWTVEPGSRLRLLISATDSAYAVPRTARADRIELADAALIAPTLNGTRVAGSADSETDTESIGVALAIIAALLAIGAAAAWDRRQRRREPVRPDLADIPLTVANLVKTYADGHRAVDDVSWEARRGQVVGLLGPNGAGKTTTLRMVMGLIAPDSGTAYLGLSLIHI